MASGTVTSLQSLEASSDLSALESSLFRERSNTVSDLHVLENGTELAMLQSLEADFTPTLLEILEAFDRLDRDDERLHTLFLEFLLKPREKKHGLSDKFLKALLKKARFWSGDRTIDVDLTDDFTDMEVIREKESDQGIPDLKLKNQRLKLVLLVENKTQSGEGHRQLARYWEDAERDHPSFAIGGLFLTPNGRPPTTHEKYDYRAISYGEVAELLDGCAESRSKDLGVVLVRQYASAIRRWFVEDPEKKKLAWRIYKKFPDAAAYLSTDSAKPSWQISEHLHGLVKKSSSKLEPVKPSQNTRVVDLWFVPREWDNIGRLRHAGTAMVEKNTDGKLADDRMLVFFLYCSPESDHEYERQLNVYLGAVPGASGEEIRSVISAINRDVPHSSPDILIHVEPRSGLDWTHLWARRFLTEEHLGELDRDVVFKLIDEAWQKFLDSDLPKINAAIAALFQKSAMRTSA